MTEKYCKICNYRTNRISDYKKHLRTRKHLRRVGLKVDEYECKCGKGYATRQGLSVHKRMCMDQSIDTQKMFATMMEMMKRTSTPVITENNTILNINVYLNKECSNAISIQEFVDKLKIRMEDITKDKLKSIKRILLKNLKPLSITERPIHCGNRENSEWYIKDERNGWEGDNGDRIIKDIEYGINKWWPKEFESKNPLWKENNKLQYEYLELLESTMGMLKRDEKEKLLTAIGSKVILM